MLLQKSADDRDFPARVLAADEVCFTRDDVVNFHNVHVLKFIRASRNVSFGMKLS
jgi:hypothetical protein